MFQRLGFGEIALIAGVVLLIFGPAKLPQVGKSIGEAMREFKKSIRPVSSEEETPANAETATEKQ